MAETAQADAVFVADAADPTGTAGLRRAFRAAGKLRMRQLRAQLRLAVMEQDVLGFSGPALGGLIYQPAEVRMRALAGWMQAAAGSILDGSWLSWWVAKAWASGEKAAVRQMGSGSIGQGSGALLELARVELHGIVAALTQAVAREAARAVAKKRPRKALVWRRLARAFDKVGPPRISALANTITVMGHNHGKLAAYRANGIQWVGVTPEHVRDHLHHLRDAKNRKPPRNVHPGYEERGPARPEWELEEVDEPIEVGVRTAGDVWVCQECDAFASNSPHDIDVVEDTLPIHPNCRCTWFPWDDKRWARDAYNEKYVESEHPRGQGGKWQEKGTGKESPYERWARTHGDHPGAGYSPGARLVNGIIRTSNVYDAQLALFQNRRVELKQPKQVSTLIKRLGETAAEMAEAGEKAPVFNLCLVSIHGTNLFCAESLGIPRVKMPVIPAKRTKEFVEHLRSLGYKVKNDEERAAHLRATQDEIDGAKVAVSMKRIKKEGFYKRLVVSKDDYILDGHHTWAAQLGVDAQDDDLRDDKHVKVARVDISIVKLIAEADKWTKAQGIVKKAAGQDAFFNQRFKDIYEEVKHPRDPRGRWTHGGGWEKAGLKHDPEMDAAWQAAKQHGHWKQYGELMKDRLDEIAKEMKLEPSRVSVSLEQQSGLTGGTVLGSTDNAGTHIVMYARVCPPHVFGGTFVHEATHIKYTRYREAYKAEKAQVEALPEHERLAAFERGEFALYQEFENLWDIPALQAEGGVTDYSKWWWKRTIGTGKWASSAVYETLAEMARVKYETGELPGGPRHKALYQNMNMVWYGKKPMGYADAALERGPSMVVWLTENFEPCEADEADMAKIVRADGGPPRFEWLRTGARDAWSEALHPRGVSTAGTTPGSFVKGGGREAKPASFEKKKLGEHKHFKAAANLEEHKTAVAAVLEMTALANHTYRWKMGKLVEQAKEFGNKDKDYASKDVLADVVAIKKKIGESFMREAISKVGKIGFAAADKMVAKAKSMGFEPSPEQMAALNKAKMEGNLEKVAQAKENVAAKAAKFEAAVAAGKSTTEAVAAMHEPPPAPSIEKPKATIPVAKPDWTQLGPQKGSVEGGFYGDPQGNSWYVKTPKTEDHVHADLLANRLYKLAGAKVSDEIKTVLNGKPAVASKIIVGTETLAQLQGSADANLAYQSLREHFAVDAWLGNRDVIGLGFDNVLMNTKDKTVYRIDQGGSLMYRAQGQTKEFGGIVTEFDTMRDKNVNPQTASVFGSMNTAELIGSIGKVLAVSDETIKYEVAHHGFPPSLAKTLIARKVNLAQIASDLAKKDPAGAPAGQTYKEKVEAEAAKFAAAMASKGKATEAELKKAAKTGTFYPAPTSMIGQQLVAPWNQKWAAKSGLSAEELEQKVAEYKAIKSQIEQAEAAAQSEAQAAAKKAQAEAKKKEKAEEAKHAEELKEIVSGLGINPHDAEAVDAFIKMSGGKPSTILQQFKTFQETGKSHGLPIAPFQYAMIQSYVDGAYKQINKELRKGYWTTRTHTYANAVNDALSKLPGYTDTLKRGFGLNKLDKNGYPISGTYDVEAQQAYAEVGNVVYWGAFSSCGKAGSFGGNMQCTIKPLPDKNKTRFRDLGPLNPHETGGEVLGMARTSLKVTKVQGSPGGDMHVWLEEVENK